MTPMMQQYQKQINQQKVGVGIHQSNSQMSFHKIGGSAAKPSTDSKLAHLSSGGSVGGEGRGFEKQFHHGVSSMTNLH